VDVQLSVPLHRTRIDAIATSLVVDVRELISAVTFYCANKADIQKAVTDVEAAAEIRNNDAAAGPILADVQALTFSIFGHGPIVRPEVGEMAVRALRAQCQDVL